MNENYGFSLVLYFTLSLSLSLSLCLSRAHGGINVKPVVGNTKKSRVTGR